MKNQSNYMIVGVLVLTVAGLMLLKGGGGGCPFMCPVEDHTAAAVGDDAQTPQTGLPKLVDLGASKCIPCKMMKPILDELREEYKGRFDVIFYDVWENTEKSKEYGVSIIPTQIFFDAAGNELFRHEGFMSKEDILGKWKELDIKFDDEVKAEQ